MKTLSIHRPCPNAHASLDRNAGEIRAGELAALAVLKISGLPDRASGRSSAATQNEASIVFDFRQEGTARLAQSMTTTSLGDPPRAEERPRWNSASMCRVASRSLSVALCDIRPSAHAQHRALSAY
jgi:hypothetical protein